jgi:hypothetical protein
MSMKRTRVFLCPSKSTTPKRTNTQATPKKTTISARTLFPGSSTHKDTPTEKGSRTETSNVRREINKQSSTKIDFATFRQFFIEITKDEEAAASFRNMMMPVVEPLIVQNTANIKTITTTTNWK